MQRRSLEELINTEDPGWPLVQGWIAAAHNQVEVLDVGRARGEDVLLHLQVTTRSPMGAIAFETGGILIDHGWLRFLGSGHEQMKGDLQSWNTSEDLLKGGLIIAHDAVGGFFALNGGAFPGKPGTVFYFAPDTLTWETTNRSYSELLTWALAGDLALFYDTMRWPGWEQDLATLTGDQGVAIMPFLFSREGGPIANRSRRPVPMDELWRLHLDLAHQFGNLPVGTAFAVSLLDHPTENE
ncbi:DUF2625 domain-containing protein [Ktedonobacteria bacterium brp13]|nr:DUF2625 domain-containing protein [Ktedonobacteria bacterium brp13]